MKRKIAKYLFLVFLLVGGLAGQATNDPNFKAGVAAYDAGNYDPAAQCFQKSVTRQPAPGTLLNLGLAEWQNDRPGRAIVAWEQSSWLDPFAAAARSNLRHAQESAQINPPDLTWCEQASTWLPANWWTWIGSGSLWLAVAMVTLPGFFRLRKSGWHQTLAALALGIWIFSLAPNIGLFSRAAIGIVIEKNIALQLTPTRSAEVVASLSAGEPVRQLRVRGDYIFVHTAYGDGWVGRKQISFISPK